MGYRSEVVFACTADAVPTLLSWCEKHPNLKSLLFSDTDTAYIGDYDGEGSYLFHWDWIKWATYHDSIQKFYSMIRDIGDRLGGGCYRLVRYGEEAGDNEVEGYAFEEIQIQRTIHF